MRADGERGPMHKQNDAPLMVCNPEIDRGPKDSRYTSKLSCLGTRNFPAVGQFKLTWCAVTKSFGKEATPSSNRASFPSFLFSLDLVVFLPFSLLALDKEGRRYHPLEVPCGSHPSTSSRCIVGFGLSPRCRKIY